MSSSLRDSGDFCGLGVGRVLELGFDSHSELRRFTLVVRWIWRWGARGRNNHGDRRLTRCGTLIFVVFTFFTVCMFVLWHRA